MKRLNFLGGIMKYLITTMVFIFPVLLFQLLNGMKQDVEE